MTIIQDADWKNLSYEFPRIKTDKTPDSTKEITKTRYLRSKDL